MATLHIETRTTTLKPRRRILVTELFVDERAALDLLRKTQQNQSRDVQWPDGHLEVFKFNKAGQLTGPSDSRLLPAKCRRLHGEWYLDSSRVYTRLADGSFGTVEVPRG